MKVLHVIPSVSTVRGGPSRAVLGMVRALRGAGCAAEIACTDDDGPGRLDVALDGPVDVEGASVRFFPRWSPPVAVLREFQYSPPFGAWLRRHIGDYDLLHVHAVFSHASTLAMIEARRRGRPYIVRPIGQLSPWSLDQKCLKKRLYLALVERRNLRGAAGIHCTSEAERRDVLAFDRSLPAFVSPIGADPPRVLDDVGRRLRERFGIAAKTPVILYLGRLHRKKGIEILIDACKELGEVDFGLVIAGSGDARYEASLRERAAGLGEKARFVGQVSGDDKDLLLQGSDVFALPSAHENFGIAVLEAMMGGVRAVVTPGVALADFVAGPGMGMVVEGTPGAFATAIRRLLGTWPVPDGERRRIRGAAEEAFSWDGIARGLAAVYGKTLAPWRRGAGSFDHG